ncbi:Ig-like domain repeat protein [Nocardioides hwasunensis]|uniref:Ig-like domain repeat protein n=1 Tax=Nocardioides hwasunensis TaxID=397258 RepID=A0ABR8ME93_9ACTN|nr:Ig-like domain repeat protein [Nocardioides hwasunensis]MBD3913386.1 Ig-like domain repeat protein [Nocardioides hwasunensis]
MPRTSFGSITRASRAALVVALTVTATFVALSQPAQATPDAPVGLTASGTPVPTLSWARVSGAQRYRVQGSEDSSFPSNNLVFNTETTNDRYTPTRVLRNGTLYWQVQAIDASGAGSWSRSETTIAPLQVPPGLQVSTGQQVLPPVSPPVISWQAVPGATGYDIELDDNGDWVGTSLRQDIRTTSYVWPDPQEVGDYFVRVRARFENNLQSAWSDVTTYDVTQLPAVTSTTCASGLACAPDPAGGVRSSVSMQDVVLSWDPIKGAKQYELQIALDRDFQNRVEPVGATSRLLTYSTRYSPATTYSNGNYYWRVRAINAAGQATPWPSTPSEFQRRWDSKPTLLYPADGATDVADDIYYQWTPVQHATRYALDISNDSNFTTYSTCETASTTYVPGDERRSSCNPNQGTNVYWRVRALDLPKGIESLTSASSRFTYSSGEIQVLEPGPNASVSVPTLRWKPSQDANKYAITLEGPGGATVTATTASTSWTPTELLPSDSDTDDPQRLPDRFDYWIAAIDGDGKSSVTYHSGSFLVAESVPASSSGLSPLTPLPSAGGQVPSRFPSLTWVPYASTEGSRVQYQLQISETNNNVIVSPGATPILNKRLAYPAVTDLDTYFLRQGTYSWRVLAINGQTGATFDVGPWATFTISAPEPVDGEKVALDGLAIDAGNACTKQLVVGDESTVCTGMSATPVLDWDPVPGAGGYQVYVSRDPDFTTKIYDGVQTINSRFTPHVAMSPQQLPDNESGPAYYWYVRPCAQVMPLRNCGPAPSGTLDAGRGAFRKVSPKVQLQSPAPGATIADQVTFTWQDYEATNRATPPQYGGTRRPYQTARGYKIQVATSETFSGASIIENSNFEIDQATFTASTKTYPEGDLWWRVQAVDAAGNELPWSDPRKVVKSTPPLSLASPAFDSRQASGPTLFRWAAGNFDGTWNIEVYRNDDTTQSSANRVLSTQVKQAAVVLPSVLPPSASAYRWRVQRVDVAGNTGRWSDFGRFFVDDRPVTLSSPADGAVLQPNAVHLTWTPYATGATQATKYTVQVSNVSGGASPGATTTSATAASMTGNLVGGTYAWVVRAFDAQNNLLGSSAERRFTVDAGLEATTPVRIDAPSGSAIGQTLTSTPPTWNQTDVAMSYQWLRSGQPIGGANGPTYTLTTADYTRVVALRVTGTKAAYTDASTTSNEFSVTAGGALQATGQPVVSGSAAVGSSLSVTNGSWSPVATRFRYQWLRQGAPIPGATGSTYRIGADDAGRDVSVTVFASATGFNEGAATTAAVSVGRMKSSVAATLPKTRVKLKKVAKLGVTVTVPGLDTPTGTIQVLDKGKKIAQMTMAPAHKGKATLKLKKLKKGKHKLQVVYLGNGQVFGSKSKMLVLFVVK